MNSETCCLKSFSLSVCPELAIELTSARKKIQITLAYITRSDFFWLKAARFQQAWHKLTKVRRFKSSKVIETIMDHMTPLSPNHAAPFEEHNIWNDNVFTTYYQITLHTYAPAKTNTLVAMQNSQTQPLKNPFGFRWSELTMGSWVMGFHKNCWKLPWVSQARHI